MPKIKQSPKLPPELRRHQLLKAARTLFVKKGYQGTTTEEIARRAGLTKGALYHHFTNKEDILMGLLEELHQTYGEKLESAAKGEKLSPVDVLNALLTAHSTDNLTEFRSMVDLWVQGMRIPRVRKRMADSYNEAATNLARMMDPIYGRTLIERERIVQFVLCFYDGLAARISMNLGGLDLEHQLKVFTRSIQCLKRENN